ARTPLHRLSLHDALPISATATHSTGRHRREGGCPSGNRRTTRSSEATAKIGAALPTDATVWTAGSEPGSVTSPRRAYCSARTARSEEHTSELQSRGELVW